MLLPQPENQKLPAQSHIFDDISSIQSLLDNNENQVLQEIS